MIRPSRELVEAVAKQLSEIAVRDTELLPTEEFKDGDRYQYNSVLYRVVQSRTTQDNWTPDITPALWTVVSLDEWPEWVQPVGSSDAYNKGDKVSHNGKHWVSDVDANVWAPGVYGWNEV